MAIGVYFQPKKLTLDQFNEIHRRLDEAGHGAPKGMLHHSCFGEGEQIAVFDIWESQEDFDTFGTALMPIIAEVGADAGTPMIVPIYRLDQSGEVHLTASS